MAVGAYWNMDGKRFKQIDHLIPGCRVRVIQKFFDANGDVHPVGEEFLYESVTVHGPNLTPTLHGPGGKIALNGVEPRQGRLREFFEIVFESKPKETRTAPPMPARPEKMDWDLYKIAIERACRLADAGDTGGADACVDELLKWPFPGECPVHSQLAYDIRETMMFTESGREWQKKKVRDGYSSHVASSTSGGEAAARIYHVREFYK